MDRSERVKDAVRRMADAASQISSAVSDVNEIAREIDEGDITPETRRQWEVFVDMLSEAVEAAKLMLHTLPRSH